jgi:hypothetical protein
MKVAYGMLPRPFQASAFALYQHTKHTLLIQKGEMVKEKSLKNHVGMQVRPRLFNDVVSNANIYSE